MSGTFYRHAYIGMRALKASSGGGRWGPPRAYGVLYLGRPEASVIAEAHRSLVDAVPGSTNAQQCLSNAKRQRTTSGLKREVGSDFVTIPRPIEPTFVPLR